MGWAGKDAWQSGRIPRHVTPHWVGGPMNLLALGAKCTGVDSTPTLGRGATRDIASV